MYVPHRYGIGVFAPGDASAPGETPYVTAHNLLKAHARAFRLYDAKYRANQGGMLGMTMSTEWAEPKDINNPDDVAAADRFIQVVCPTSGFKVVLTLFKYRIYRDCGCPLMSSATM